MLKHYVKVALRLIKRSFLFSSINMLGFVVGMTAAFLIYLWIVDELTFEDFNKNRNEVYRVIREVENADGQVPSTATPLSGIFRKDYPKVENATFIKYSNAADFHFGNDFIVAKLAYVDTTFFDVFDFPVVAGDPKLMKKDPQQIVISEETAKRMFGNASAIGKEVIHNFWREQRPYKVAAVLKVPRKSHIQFDVLIGWNSFLSYHKKYENNWGWSERMHVYIQLKKGQKLTDADRLAMRNLWIDHSQWGKPLDFQPLSDIHLRTTFKEPDDVYNHGNIQQIYLFAALAALIVFMGAFNFTTLSTARASQRFKEIGVRKVTGAKRHMLITQFLSESLVQAFLALLLALALTELLLPLFNRFVEKDIVLIFNWQTVLFILFGILGIGCLAGSFPAFYMSSFNPLLAFKGGQATGRKGALVKGLVCVQFVISIVMIIGTVVVFKQLHYLQNADVGLDTENLVMVDVDDWREESIPYKQEVLKNSHVKSITIGVDLSDFLQGYRWETSKFSWQDEVGRMDSLEMVGLVGDRDFFQTLGLELVKGEAFEADPDKFWSGAYNVTPIVINETAWKMLDVENSVGMILKGDLNFTGRGTSRIVGVVKDFNYQPLRVKIRPVFIYYTNQLLDKMYIKISPEKQMETLNFLKTKYEEMRPNHIFVPQFFKSVLKNNYARERQLSQVFLIFTILSILVAMMGVFGLVALSTAQRTKEIGIRKVNGAHSDRIVRMFCREYMIWVGVAFVIACPLGYLFMDRWLSNFAYQATVGWWLFPMAGLVILLITILTVIVQTWRAASRNPVTSLRYE